MSLDAQKTIIKMNHFKDTFGAVRKSVWSTNVQEYTTQSSSIVFEVRTYVHNTIFEVSLSLFTTLLVLLQGHGVGACVPLC